MSMTAQYCRVSDLELEGYLDGSAKVDAILDERFSPVGVGKTDRISMLCRRFAQSGWRATAHIAQQMGVSQEQLNAEMRKRGMHCWFDLDKSWNELHVLLTGNEMPLTLPHTNDILSLALIGEGSISGTEHFGYGPARFLKQEKVKEVASALQNVNYEHFSSRHNIAQDDSIEEIFDDFKNFYLQGALSRECVLLVFL